MLELERKLLEIVRAHDVATTPKMSNSLVTVKLKAWLHGSAHVQASIVGLSYSIVYKTLKGELMTLAGNRSLKISRSVVELNVVQ